MTSPPLRVETVAVPRASRLPKVVAALAVAMVVASIIKPWTANDPRLDRPRPSPLPAVLDAPLPSIAPGPAATPAMPTNAPAATLAPGQVACGSSDWQLVTLGNFIGWTVRTWIAIAPAEARDPSDPSIPVVSLRGSDLAGLGACGPAARPEGRGGAATIVAAWRRGGEGSTHATFGRLALSNLDTPPGSPAGPSATLASPAPVSAVELVIPTSSAQQGRWPVGRYVLRLAAADGGPDRWVAVDIAGLSR